jgi:acyl carrier protein
VSTLTAGDVKRAILASMRPQLQAMGYDPDSLPDTFDLRAEGVVDSLRFVQLLADLEERLGTEVDVADLEPEALTIVGRLAAHISAPRARSITQ